MSKKNSDRRGDSIRWISRESIVPEDIIPPPQRPAPKKATASIPKSSQKKGNKK